MATVLVTVDDITGEEGATGVLFGWNGKLYRIDLTEEGKAEFDRDMACWVQFANEQGKLDVSSGRRPPVPQPRSDDDAGRHTAEEIALCREWAERENVKLPGARGRIPARIWGAWRTRDLSRLRPDDFINGEPSGRQLAMADALDKKAS